MALSMTHIVQAGSTGRPVLLLLHGTGGNEHDLVDLARTVAPDAGILSVRGNVLENGMPRFFKRLNEGVFDMADLAERTAELAAFIRAAKNHYKLAETPLYALGFSNGANIATSLLLTDPDTLDGAMLLRAMLPYEVGITPDLRDKPILMLNGVMDHIVPGEQVRMLEQVLHKAGATVTAINQPAGHGLTQTDVTAMQSWWAGIN